MPFSLWRTTSMPAGRWSGINVGMPTPRLTYWPSRNSRATRAASCPRVSAISPSLWWSYGPNLDALALRANGGVHDPGHKDPRRVYLVRVDLSRLHQMLDLGDRQPAGRGAERIEIAGAAPVNEVAVPIPHVRVDQTHIGVDRPLENVRHAVEFPYLLGRGRHGY